MNKHKNEQGTLRNRTYGVLLYRVTGFLINLALPIISCADSYTEKSDISILG